MARLVGRTLGRYEIVELIGAGGMGEVYKARDTELGRDVAVKVISTKIAPKQKSIDRFEREAKTVAQLSHPNILDIHDFGRDGEHVFAVTELLEGSDLRERTRNKRLPLSKTLEIGIAVANGLAAAHSKGIVHRDIKPENVFVTSTGQVKILDFGIAGLKDDAAITDFADPEAKTESLTGTGVVVGTVGYMSPEQVRGESVDARSDIFAFGCLLYEMLAGHRAFQQATAADTMRAILDQDPDPISDYWPDVAPALEVIVARCLEKEPDERFESARDVAFALQTLTGARKANSGAQTQVNAIRARRRWASAVALLIVMAVATTVWFGTDLFRSPPALPEQLRLGLLPLETSGADSELADFAVGLGMSLTEDLALVAQQEGGIRWIVPPEIAMEYRGSDAAKFGRDYGLTGVVTGRLQAAGTGVRLALDIVDPSTDGSLRTIVIEDVPSNVEVFQHGPARRVTESLGVEISSETRERIESSSTTTTGAFDLFTRGRGALALATISDEIRVAADLIDDAVAEDPLFAGALVARARCRLAVLEATGEPVWLDRGIDDAKEALDLRGRPEAAYRVLAALQVAAGEPDRAVDALERGIRSAPRDPELRLKLAEIHQDAGRFDEARLQIDQAIYLRPDYWVGYNRLAFLHLSRGNLESAAIEFNHIIDSAPGYVLGYVKLAAVYMYLERREAARPLLEKSLEIEVTPSALTNLGSIHFDASRFAQAADYYRRSIELQSDDHVLWGNLGYASRFGIEPEKAEEAFDRAAQLAEKALAEAPGDLDIAVALAGYHAMLGNWERGLELLDAVVEADPTNPMLVPSIAEVYEDLGERERALEWVARSFEVGVLPIRFEGRPTLSKLVADERYQALVPKDPGV